MRLLDGVAWHTHFTVHDGKVFVLIYFKGRVTERERNKYFLFHFPVTYKIQNWARLKLGIQNSNRISHKDSWLPGCISRKLDEKQGNWDLNQHSYVECTCPNQQLNPLHHNTHPRAPIS